MAGFAEGSGVDMREREKADTKGFWLLGGKKELLFAEIGQQEV